MEFEKWSVTHWVVQKVSQCRNINSTYENRIKTCKWDLISLSNSRTRPQRQKLTSLVLVNPAIKMWWSFILLKLIKNSLNWSYSTISVRPTQNKKIVTQSIVGYFGVLPERFLLFRHILLLLIFFIILSVNFYFILSCTYDSYISYLHNAMLRKVRCSLPKKINNFW